ncbi:pentatricopeptide repeat-containing protein At5g18950 [Phalaenopsis equestris]|uniref:pentatricopeptide repeat-containing protein At5g18950 n=1 Tax=Phalaenopsis equestris TaxID=78828 RepID=UPI0009E575E4|nr:pentatricopeptide repeat-containing protein At5g18950 [Phalaenopsis equestris]
MFKSKLPAKTTRHRSSSFYFAGDHFVRRPFSSSATSTEKNDRTSQLHETASKVCDVIRRQPRWELSFRSLFPPTSAIFHPNCISLVIHHLSDSNPLLSFRYLLWLSSTSSTFSLDPEAAASFLNALAACRSWRSALHAIRLVKGLNNVSVLDTFVLHLCSDTRSIYRDKNLLYELRDVVENHSTKLSLRSWNSILSASLISEKTDLFHSCYAMMIAAGTTPDASTAGYLIRALCRDGEPNEAYHVLRDVSRKGIIPDVVSTTQLISSFSKAGDFGRVSAILHLMIACGSQPDLLTYQEIIHALCDGAGGATMVHEAFRIFTDLKLKGYACDVVMYTSMIHGLCKICRMGEALLLWSEMIAKGIQPNNYTYNAVINGYCKAGNMDHARKLYAEMLSTGFEESTVSCNTMLAGLCLNDMLADAINLFSEMPNRGIMRDVITYNILIHCLCKEGKTSDAIELYSSLLATSIKPSVSTYTPLIMALCEECRATEAVELMKLMKAQELEPLVCSNDVIIAGFCKLGDAENGMTWLFKMLQSNLKPRAETMNRLVECLCSLGLVDYALQVVKTTFDINYSLASSVCHVLISKLCEVDSSRSCELLDEVVLMER